MSVESNKAIVKNLFTAFNQHDVERAVSEIADDAELVDLALGLSFHGVEGFRQWLQTFLTALPDATTEVTLLIGEGDWVASEHIGRGTHTGPLMTPGGPIPPTGRSLELRFSETYQIRDGKLARMHAYYDGATMMRQLGLM